MLLFKRGTMEQPSPFKPHYEIRFEEQRLELICNFNIFMEIHVFQRVYEIFTVS